GWAARPGRRCRVRQRCCVRQRRWPRARATADTHARPFPAHAVPVRVVAGALGPAAVAVPVTWAHAAVTHAVPDAARAAVVADAVPHAVVADAVPPAARPAVVVAGAVAILVADATVGPGPERGTGVAAGLAR